MLAPEEQGKHERTGYHAVLLSQYILGWFNRLNNSLVIYIYNLYIYICAASPCGTHKNNNKPTKATTNFTIVEIAYCD